MASRASPPQKRTSGSDGLDAERKYKFNFEIKLRSVEKEAFKRRLSKVRGLLIPPCSSKPLYLDILRESHGSMVSRKFVNFPFKYCRNTAQWRPERYQVFHV